MKSKSENMVLSSNSTIQLKRKGEGFQLQLSNNSKVLEALKI